MLVKAEGFPTPPPAINRDPVSLMDGNALEPGSPAIGRGDMGQDAGYIRPMGPPPEGNFTLPGDCNNDGTLDLSDVIHLLGFLFQGNPESLPCLSEAGNLDLMDVNTDGAIDLSDSIFLLAFLFQGGGPPDQGVVCIDLECPPNPGCTP